MPGLAADVYRLLATFFGECNWSETGRRGAAVARQSASPAELCYYQHRELWSSRMLIEGNHRDRGIRVRASCNSAYESDGSLTYRLPTAYRLDAGTVRHRSDASYRRMDCRHRY